MSLTSNTAPDSTEPAWDIARLFPMQGQWTDADFLTFSEPLNQLVELVDGHIEVPEMPTKSHQKVVQFLLNQLLAFLVPGGLGDAIGAPYRVRLRDQTFREPDLVVYLNRNLDHFGERFGDGADLIMEVVSGDMASRARDYDAKRGDYAAGGVSEYWIVDPSERRITVLSLGSGTYDVIGEFGANETAVSRLLNGFHVSVAEVLRVAEAASFGR